ncbi:MAG: glycosyltransferase [Alistipes sp.]|nr:glycosyltransferase [Alistipes sp.]
MQPQVSVIIPVYNLESYIDACLGSVAAQTFTDFEAIVIDDGSTDGSYELLKRRADHDPRIIVIRKPNEGVAKARETALEHARGRYICFLDGDDLWEPDMLERLTSAIEETGKGYDIVCCDYKRISPGKGESPVCSQHGQDLAGEEFLIRTLAMSDSVALWARLYRRELFAGLHHYPMRQGQDLLLNIQIGCRRPRVHHIDYVGYGYVQRAGSSIRRKPDFDYCCAFAAKVEAILSAHATEFGDRIEWLRLLNAVWWYAGYVSRSSNPWKGDTPFAAWVRRGAVRYRKELLAHHAPIRLFMIRMDGRRWLRPAIIVLGTLLRWKQSIERRMTR